MLFTSCNMHEQCAPASGAAQRARLQAADVCGLLFLEQRFVLPKCSCWEQQCLHAAEVAAVKLPFREEMVLHVVGGIGYAQKEVGNWCTATCQG